MKKVLIIGIIIGLIIGSTTILAVSNYLYKADEVSYTPSDTSWNVDNVNSAIDSLRTQSGNALTNLKNTNIAKAVNANGDTLSSVISTLGNITNRSNKSFTISNTNAVTIPAGYYDGTGKIQTSDMMVTPTQTLTLSDVTSGTDVTNYKTVKTSGLMKTPTATKSITANGSNIDVLNYSKVNVNVSSVSSLKYLGKGTWNYSQYTTSYAFRVSGLKNENLIMVTASDNSNSCGDVSVSVSNGTVSLIDNGSYFDYYNGIESNVSQRTKIYKWTGVTTSTATVTVNILNIPKTSTSYAVVFSS